MQNERHADLNLKAHILEKQGGYASSHGQL